MTTFGSFPGVQVQTQGGGISGVQVGSEETLVIFGRSTSGGSVAEEEPAQIGSRQDADSKFGDGSELANAMKEALANGANINYLWGVGYSATAETESFTGISSGTLASTPIDEHADITVTDTQASEDMTVEFYYGDGAGSTAPTQPSETNTVVINPHTGEWAADSSTDYDFSYEVPQWNDVFDAADNLVNEDETAVYAALTNAEDVVVDLSGKVTTLRGEYQMVKGVAGAPPNDTDETGDPRYATSTYDDAVDDDSMFLIAPTRREGSRYSIIGGVAGLFAGHAINEPVYNDAVSGYTDLEQKFSRSEAQDLRDVEVIPVRQSGTVRLKDNLSTSTETDWKRDFWRRRIVDRVILLGKIVGDATVGRINDENTRKAAEDTLFAELNALVGERLLEPNTGEETNWYVEVYQEPTDPDQVNIDIGITPQGIVKRVDESITINT